MKTRIIIICLIVIGSGSFFAYRAMGFHKPIGKGCVFKTVFGEEPIDSNFIHQPTERIVGSLEEGLIWLEKAQHPDGGWGAGFHHAQGNMDPHQVPADPATTAMVSMAILRSGSNLERGAYQKPLKQATDFLLSALESTPPDGSKITDLTNTQIQRKLGDNIDLILTVQYLSNLLNELEEGTTLYDRVFNAINKGVDKVETVQAANGSTKGSGWAGVLQSAFATNALESAQSKGAWVNEETLDKSRDYQKKNYDYKSNTASTKDGAGVMLYAVSGSVRASAKEAREAEKLIAKAKKEGLLEAEAEVNESNLIKAGMKENKAMSHNSAYQVYTSAKVQAQRKDVMKGFGNNGGEEFVSYLQTGESMIINKDISWKNWFDGVSSELLNIQNNDGSWNGHHCITSPVFCTATCVLILSVNNDIEELVALGATSATPVSDKQ